MPYATMFLWSERTQIDATSVTENSCCPLCCVYIRMWTLVCGRNLYLTQIDWLIETCWKRRWNDMYWKWKQTKKDTATCMMYVWSSWFQRGSLIYSDFEQCHTFFRRRILFFSRIDDLYFTYIVFNPNMYWIIPTIMQMHALCRPFRQYLN